MLDILLRLVFLGTTGSWPIFQYLQCHAAKATVGEATNSYYGYYLPCVSAYFVFAAHTNNNLRRLYSQCSSYRIFYQLLNDLMLPFYSCTVSLFECCLLHIIPVFLQGFRAVRFWSFCLAESGTYEEKYLKCASLFGYQLPVVRARLWVKMQQNFLTKKKQTLKRRSKKQ